MSQPPAFQLRQAATKSLHSVQFGIRHFREHVTCLIQLHGNRASVARHHLCVHTLHLSISRRCSGGRTDFAMSALWQTNVGSRHSIERTPIRTERRNARGGVTASTQRKRIAAHRDHWLRQPTQHPIASLAAAPANAERTKAAARFRADLASINFFGSQETVVAGVSPANKKSSRHGCHYRRGMLFCFRKT